MSVDKKITLCLVGLDGNAFALMGAFSRQANDYNHLVQTLMDHCENSGAGREE